MNEIIVKWTRKEDREPDCDCIVYNSKTGWTSFSFKEEWDADDWEWDWWIPLPEKATWWCE